MGTRHASPELALQAIEAAYASRDPEAAVAARDFVSEAAAMLRDVLGESDPPDERVQSSARMLEHAFRTHLEDDGFPDMVTTSRRLVAVRMVRPDLAALVQECTFPDGSVAEEITHAIRTAHGWGIVELHGETAQVEAGCRALADGVGARVIAGDIAGVRAVLAPWLQVELTEASLEALLAAASEGLRVPASWTVDSGMADLETLRSPDGFGPPTRPLPAEVTPENFRGWVCVQFQPDPANSSGHNACFDLWLVVVMHEGSWRIGYLEAAEAT